MTQAQKVHSTAQIDPKTELDSSVEIGAFTVVGPNVRMGAGTRVGHHTVVRGYTTLGRDNSIGHFALVGGRPQDMKYRDEPTQLIVGDRNTIREFTTIHAGMAQDAGITSIGDDSWIMAYVYIAHDCRVGNHTAFSSNAQIAGHMEVGDWAILGGMSGMHQFVHIGVHTMLGGTSALVQDVPLFVIAASDKDGNKAAPHGINVESLRRRGFTAEQITGSHQAYKLLYKSDLSFDQAKAEAAAQIAQTGDALTREVLTAFADFIAVTKCGIMC